MAAAWIVLILGLCVLQVQSNCYFSKLKWSARGQPYCEDQKSGEVLQMGETRVSKDCIQCNCSKNGLQCCGIGPDNSGVKKLLPGCQVVPKENCKWSINCTDT